MGKLPYMFFKKEGTANVNKRALKIFPFVYFFLSALPIALTISSLIQAASIYKFALLVSILVFSVYTAIIRRKTLLG
jgi:hypothetical protein